MVLCPGSLGCLDRSLDNQIIPMKQSHTKIPPKMRAEMAADPFYSICSLAHVPGHICGGKVTWEHAIIFAGKKVQEKWAIPPICERGHAVNSFQDAGTMKKEVNVWVALNRANDDELRAVSKVVDYIRERARLNTIYGIWSPPAPAIEDVRL